MYLEWLAGGWCGMHDNASILKNKRSPSLQKHRKYVKLNWGNENDHDAA